MPLNLASTALPKPERLRQTIKNTTEKTAFDIYKKNSSSNSANLMSVFHLFTSTILCNVNYPSFAGQVV